MWLLHPQGCQKRDKWEHMPYRMDVQTDLSLCWYRSYCRFCSALAPIIATDKALFSSKKCCQISFLFFNINICCVYSLEVPQQGASNEFPQHMFYWEIKKLLCGYPLLSVIMLKYIFFIWIHLLYRAISHMWCACAIWSKSVRFIWRMCVHCRKL